MTVTAPIESAFPEPGKVFAERYEIARLLGTGGHSRVYAAMQRGFDREVAVKILNIDRGGSRSVRETMEKRFYREARLLSRLRGPNTLRVYDYGRTENGQLFMVSELVPGTDLKTLLSDSGALGERRARRIFEQILQGLMEVHAEGFLHRDIKPSNIMIYDHVGRRDRVKLLDFGIAKGMSRYVPDETALTRAGFVIGTPGYMSPEQALGHEMLESGDVFSAGLVAFEMLTGRAPWAGLSLEQQQQRIRAGSLQLPATVDVEDDFAAVVHRCLQSNPSLRYQSAAEALSDLGIAPDTVELPAAAPRRPPPNVLTFPMHVDFTGTTQFDTLTDAQTGETKALGLPESELRQRASVSLEDAGTTMGSDEGARKRSNAWGVKVGVALLLVVVACAVWFATRGGEQVEDRSSSPFLADQVAEAVDQATNVVGRTVRNAELDATIAAKEAALVADPEPSSENMEFDVDDSINSVIERDDAQPEPAPRPPPEIVPDEPDSSQRSIRRQEEREDEPQERPTRTFEVKMVDEL